MRLRGEAVSPTASLGTTRHLYKEGSQSGALVKLELAKPSTDKVGVSLQSSSKPSSKKTRRPKRSTTMSDTTKSIVLPTFNGEEEAFQVWWTKFQAYSGAYLWFSVKDEFQGKKVSAWLLGLGGACCMQVSCWKFSKTHRAKKVWCKQWMRSSWRCQSWVITSRVLVLFAGNSNSWLQAWFEWRCCSIGSCPNSFCSRST